MERFVDHHVFRTQRFSLGLDRLTMRRFISLPVSGFNRAVEYEARFAISDDEFSLFASDPDAAAELIEKLSLSPDDPRRIP